MPPKPGARRPTRTASRAQSAKTARAAKENPLAMEEEEVSIEIEDLAVHDESTNILIHGPYGAGKTVLASGAPNAVFLSTEKGAIAAERVGSKAKIMRAFDWQHAVAGVRKADNELGPDNWLIVDSGTKMQQLYLRWMLRKIKDANPARSLDIPAIQDHQQWQNGFKRWCDHLIDAKYNVIFITTSMREYDQEGEPIVIPQLVGKEGAISDYVSSQFDIVTHYMVGPREKISDPTIRRALFETYGPYYAKNRYHGVLGKYQLVEEDDFSIISYWIDLIKGIEVDAEDAS